MTSWAAFPTGSSTSCAAFLGWSLTSVESRRRPSSGNKGVEREQGTGNRERGTGNGEQGTGNGERGTGNGLSVPPSFRSLSDATGQSQRPPAFRSPLPPTRSRRPPVPCSPFPLLPAPAPHPGQ